MPKTWEEYAQRAEELLEEARKSAEDKPGPKTMMLMQEAAINATLSQGAPRASDWLGQ